MTQRQPSPEQLRACVGKRRYLTKRGAEGVVLRIATQEHDETIDVYRCKWCGGWYVGHRRKDWQR